MSSRGLSEISKSNLFAPLGHSTNHFATDLILIRMSVILTFYSDMLLPEIEAVSVALYLLTCFEAPKNRTSLRRWKRDCGEAGGPSFTQVVVSRGTSDRIMPREHSIPEADGPWGLILLYA